MSIPYKWLNTAPAQRIIDKYQVVIIFVGGSRLTPFVTPTSDYDLCCISLKCPQEKMIKGHEFEYYLIDNIPLHWYVNGPEGFNYVTSIGTSTGWCKLLGLNQNSAIYIRPGYEYIREWYLKHSREIALVGLYYSVLYYPDWWDKRIKKTSWQIPYKGLYSILWTARELGFIGIADEEILNLKIKNDHCTRQECEYYRKLFLQLTIQLQGQMQKCLTTQSQLKKSGALLYGEYK